MSLRVALVVAALVAATLGIFWWVDRPEAEPPAARPLLRRDGGSFAPHPDRIRPRKPI